MFCVWVFQYKSIEDFKCFEMSFYSIKGIILPVWILKYLSNEICYINDKNVKAQEPNENQYCIFQLMFQFLASTEVNICVFSIFSVRHSFRRIINIWFLTLFLAYNVCQTLSKQKVQILIFCLFWFPQCYKTCCEYLKF